jgi:hypothetical protein
MYNVTSIRDARVILITPEMAKEMLKKNVSNRAIRKVVVKGYADDMLAGAWRTTHQGIAFNSNGDLVDGQHRLSAIVLANKPIEMLICTYAENFGATNSPLDMHVKRTVSDILGHAPSHMAVLQLLINDIAYIHGRKEVIIAKMIDRLGTKYTWLEHNIARPQTRLFSAAPIRAGCFAAYLAGYNWIDQYNALISNNIKDLDNSAYLLYKKLSPTIGSTVTSNFRSLAFDCTFAVATGMMESQQRFTEGLLDRSRKQARAVIMPYLE